MGSSATRRVRGRGQGGGSEPRIRPKAPAREYNLPALVAVSIVIHTIFIAAFVYLPGLLPHREKDVKMYSITMTTLPPGPAGGGGESTEVEKAPPEPEEKPPEPDKEAVKLAGKTTKKPEPAPVRTTEKPKPEKAPETSAPVARTPTVSTPLPAGPGQGPVGGGKTGETQEGPIPFPGGIPFPFPEYITVIEKKVRRNWHPPELTMRKRPKVVVSFRIDRRGRVSEINVEKSSGISLVDRSAMSAVKDASPIEGFPKEFEGNSLKVLYNFIVAERK